MKKTRYATLVIVVIMLLIITVPAAAVTDGEPDGNGHPYVGMYYFSDPDGDWRCSGTLLSPTVFLTAGHCTFEAFNARVAFESEITDDSTWYSGVAYSFPGYATGPWFANDVGVVILKKPGIKNLEVYGELPKADQLDSLATERGQQDITFTAVGYGLQQIVDNPVWGPIHLQADKVRMVANPKLNQINAPGFTGDYSLLLSNNHSTGGTCFGDSGGPNFLGDSNVVAGVTSFGMNGNCGGTGGVFRVDRQEVLDFVQSFLGKKKQIDQ